MNRRTYLSITSLAGLTGLAGCNSGLLNQPNKQNNGDNELTPESTAIPTDEQAEVLAEFSGQKSTVTDSFPTTYTELQFDIDFSVTSGFSAHLIDPLEEQDDRLLLDVPHTRFQGTVVVSDQSESDEWALRIETDDMEGFDEEIRRWEITVRGPQLTLVDDE